MQTFAATTTTYRSAGWLTIASGIAGIIAFAALITAVNVRNAQGMEGSATMLFRMHEVVTIIQFFLMFPLVFALYKLSHTTQRGLSKLLLNIALAALVFTILFLLLILPKIIADPLYMFPEAVFGVWLIICCSYMKALLPKGIMWFGIIVGIGLALVGLFPLGYAIFVDKVILQIPAAPDAVIEKIPSDTPANTILHYILFTGTFMGVITFPVWTILTGRMLLRKR